MLVSGWLRLTLLCLSFLIVHRESSQERTHDPVNVPTDYLLFPSHLGLGWQCGSVLFSTGETFLSRRGVTPRPATFQQVLSQPHTSH